MRLDAIVAAICRGAGLFVVLVVAMIVVMLWMQSGTSMAAFGLGFLWSSEWNPVRGLFGALPFLYGTVLSSLVALVLAVPLGLGAAIYLAEMAPYRLGQVLGMMVELLAAVPSVVYGLLASMTIVPFLRETGEPALGAVLGWMPLFQGPRVGVGYLAAGMVLAIMVLPFLISLSREALLLVPKDQREGAMALGATRWETIVGVVAPAARRGIVGSIFLGLSRALGETMAVTMVIGNSPTISASLFAPGYTIASVLANEFTEATTEVHLASLAELGLVLFGLTVAVQGLGRWILRGDAK